MISKVHILRLLLLFLAVALVADAFDLFRSRYNSRSAPDDKDDPDSGWPRPPIPYPGVTFSNGYPINEFKDHFPFQRMTLQPSGNVVACWPSYGGLWMKRISTTGAAWLDLDPTRDIDRSLNQTEEDTFCDRFERLGPAWYNLPPQWQEQYEGWFHGETRPPYYAFDILEHGVPQITSVAMELALPGYGGICAWNMDLAVPALRHRLGELRWGEYQEEWEKYGGLAALRNSRTMEERCDTMLRYGGKYCATREQCPEIARLFGVALGEQGVCKAA